MSHGQLRSSVLPLRAFTLQLTTLGFWLSGPHSWRESLLWALPMLGLFLLGKLPSPDGPKSIEAPAAGSRSLQLYALSGVQAVNYAVMLFTASLLGFHSLDAMAQTGAMLVPTSVLAGVNAGYFVVGAGRELSRSRGIFEQTIGRLLLLGVLCDPAVGASQLAASTSPAAGLQLPRQRDWRGLAVTAMVVGTLGYACGTVAVIFFLVQAATAKLLLETHTAARAGLLIESSRDVDMLEASDQVSAEA